MALQLQGPELGCLDPDTYKKYFRALCWSGTRYLEKRSQKKIGKKDKPKRSKSGNTLAVCYAPLLLGNPSQFAVYATVRKSILSRWRLLLTPAGELSDDSDNDDPSAQIAMPKLPKITGIGLRTVFALIAQARVSDALFCERALCALLDVLQGHAPEDLAQEPQDIISSLHAMLVEVAGGAGPGGRASAPGALTALGSSCLIALSVARGEAELILNAVASLIMTDSSFSEQYIQIPCNVTTLQRSVQSVLLGAPARNQWLTSGVPQHALAGSFPVELPPPLVGAGELVVRALASDGCFLYVFTSKGLLKIGSGYGDTIRQHVYLYKPDFFVSDRHGWLGYCKDKLYARIGRKKTEVYEIDKHSLEVKHVIKLDPGQPTPAEPKSAVFTDGHQLGLILLTNFDNLTIKMYDVESRGERAEDAGPLRARSEVGVHLLRRRTLALGRAPYDDGQPRRAEPTAPLAMELDDGDDDPLRTVCAGQDFALLTTASGKVYYTGKGTSLGYKTATPYPGRWILMKETVFTRNDLPGAKKCKVIQAAAGHEGAHAVLVLDNGTALFAGVARRGEDGDAAKHRRTPKPTRPKKIFKAEGHFVTYAACNHGSTALVTRQGLLLMFGKDTQNCDSVGVVTGLRHERVMQVALGKAHGVALTDMGQVYTFGINNKGQCGREFGYTKEKSYSSRQQTTGAVREEPRLCLRCRQSPAPATRRAPSQVCSCEESEGACSSCGACRCCGEVAARVPPPASDQGDGAATPAPAPAASQADARSDKENVRYPQYEGHTTMSEADREASPKVSCLPPSRLAMPGAHRVCAVACGLHHTVLLTDHGEVLTFGSNQYGQLGAGDIGAHHRVVRVRVPRASAVAAGSNHTAVLTREGELYTFGSYQKGQLGRPRPEETPRGERSSVWYAMPGRVPRMGARHACRAVWVTASGDQTFVQLSQGLINTDTLFSSTVTANHNCIMILPNQPEHTFKCVTISKADGACSAWPGAEQVDFVNSLACLDPLYDVLWCYRPQMRVIKCYNILAYDAHKLQRCCNNEPDAYSPDGHLEYPNYGSMRRLEDFKNLESYEVACNNEEKPAENVALSDVSILKQELAIPGAPGCSVTRMHAALHLLGCLDSLTYAHDTKLNQVELKQETAASPVVPVKEDFLTVNRFESHGGGWGYSGHSVEAIRFMCDTDILLGGFGLFGGRGDYTAKIKLFDIGADGGDHEGDGELLAESDEVVFECAPRDKFPVLFDAPVPLVANRWYVAWACINGPSSDCGSSGQAMVINDEIGFHFKTSKKSNNGTDVNAGQIPCLLYNAPGADPAAPARCPDAGEPVVTLSKNISRNVTVPCFKSLITLMQWSWGTFKETILDTNGQIPINYQKLTLMKHQRRLVYVIRACLRLVRSYINEIYPLHSKNKKSHEYMCYLETILEVRNLVQAMMAEQTPTCAMLPRRPGKHKAQRACYVQFALELSGAVLAEAHDTLAACYHAFFPTPPAKWNHLCSLLSQAKEGAVPARLARELGATCTALGGARSLSDTLHYVVPLTQSRLPAPPGEPRRRDSKVMKESSPAASVATPRPSGAQKPPPIPPRSNTSIKGRQAALQSSQTEWHLLEAVGQLLELVTAPIKQQMMTRACGQPHDHGEARQLERLADACCKLVARIVAELAYGATHLREDMASNTVKHLVTPSRFMRVNQTRAWNTGNGSPDAICFTVDRPGVVLVGVCAYGGLGSYEYSLELLHDVRQLRGATDEANPAHCWVSVEVAHGAFSAADCHHDMVQLKFDKPVPLKEELRYAVRLCNHGGRTANGDCGLPSVKGPDDTTFRFASCSLSFNGTTLARGQIPCLIYYSASRLNSNAPESADSLVSALQSMTLRVAGAVLERAAELFCALRNELTDEDLRRNAAVLQHSPVITTLVPFTLANLEGLVDSKSVVKVLEMVHKLLPHVAAMNLLVPSAEEFSTTTTHYYTWVESDHPYKQATVTNMRVLFPPSVAWVVLEMDPRSATAQPEDSLTVYAVAGAPRQTNRSNLATRAPDAPYRNLYKRLVQLSAEAGEAEELAEETVAPCMHYNCTYVSVTPRLANTPADWPQKALLVPGNEVIFSLETASDYLTDYNKINNEDARFGFRCLCAGYEQAPRAGLAALEAELVYAGAACAARLLAPDLDIPPLTFSTMMEVQVVAALGGDEEPPPDGCEALLLARGLELSSPPSVHQVLDGQPLLRGVSPERQFLSDFVAGAESTAGGRLARWLAPGPRVEPARCELRAPGGPARPAARLALPVLVRDQHGDLVASPALKVEVVVQRAEEPAGRRGSLPDAPYQPTLRDTMCFHAITMMKAYQAYSFEELRLAGGSWGEGGGGAATAPGALVPAERLAVRAQPDGSYVAAWTPRAPGAYTARCTLDDRPAPQELRIEVADATEERPPDRGGRASDGAVAPVPAPSRLRRFAGRHSSGLRVRASPSLQAEELGRVPPAAKVAFVEEVVNKDGTWVRLSAESVRAYTDGGAGVAWCLQHHRHLDRALLLPLEPCTPPQLEYTGVWSGYGDAQGDMQSWTQEVDEVDGDSNELTYPAERRFPLALHNDMTSESDGSCSPLLFAAEPSKRARAAAHAASPKRAQRRSNGNSEEWWTPAPAHAHAPPADNARAPFAIPETEIGEPPEPCGAGGRLAQAGTQTSPEGAGGGGEQVSSVSRERDEPRAWPPPPAPPPVAAPVPPAPPAPRKHAVSPSQAECLRAVFAALLWHEGIVHDAIACAAFLKFHPQLPKQGARVVTRAPHEPATHAQRHSVEVSNAGQYLRIAPSTLETLTRSGAEATASRLRKTDIDLPIREEEAVVSVLPPALRALVALWDALGDADELAPATGKLRRETEEKNENDWLCSGIRKKREWKSPAGAKTPYSVRCELCGGAGVPPPLAAHMRHAHPGCRGSSARGYDRAGTYRLADRPPPAALAPPAACGQLAQAYQLWYIYCEKCRDRALKASSSVKQPKTKTIGERGAAAAPSPPDHLAVRENATFLLDLAPLNDSESPGDAGRGPGGSRSPPTPPGSVWRPAPPFQCLPALGAAPKPAAADRARYHSLGRPPPAAAAAPLGALCGASGSPAGVAARVPRSVSMGQAGARGLARHAQPPLARHVPPDHDALSGGGSSLLAQPSVALQRLVGCGEWRGEVSAFEAPRVDAAALLRSPVLAFVLARRDLHAHRQKMDAAVRVNTVRQYAFEALNWLLRSTTQPTCVHDVMWWFCGALDDYARVVPPPVALDDNSEARAAAAAGAGAEPPLASRAAAAGDPARRPAAFAFACAMCPGGRAARASRAAFHALLGSVSALAPSLPPASAAALQAVRCWALHYSPHDRAFLHRSQVFSVISKILSHSEDAAHEDAALGPLHESFHSHLHEESYVWSCPDVTGWCDVSVSSRQGMAGALTDGSTETFWESGDEDRNKAKWLQVAFPGGAPPDRPHLVCVHVDNTRDTLNKTLLVTFLYNGGSSETFHVQDMEVDPKAATWLCYTLPGSSVACVRVKCEMRGPEAAVRVRQVRVLGAPEKRPEARTAPAHVLRALLEADTLRVFRLLTSHVFGKLLEWERGEAADDAAAEDAAAGDDSDLREHVVGILFAGHKLTSLQRQVMAHIVSAIGCEAARVRDDWEAAPPEADATDDGEAERPRPHRQDDYCFEMLCLLLALSGSAVGRAHLAQQTALLGDLLALLHTGSHRVQRQVVALLRRMIAEIPPQKMLAAINYGSEPTDRITLLDHLVCYLAKAIVAQVKVKGAGASAGGGGGGSLTMGGSVTPAPPSAWFVRGRTTAAHAHLAARLLADMAEDRVSPAWGPETRAALAEYATRPARIPEEDRRPERCAATPAIWTALAALCVCERSHLEPAGGAGAARDERARDADARPLCANHDDGSTAAVVECRTCGPLCAECDRFLHLNRAARTHRRRICKEEESAIRIDVHEGCGRAKLFWLLLLVDRRTLKALVEFRGSAGGPGGPGDPPAPAPGAAGSGACRFCGARGSAGLLAIGNVCADRQCQRHGRAACARTLACGHACGGVRGERECLPCLHGCAPEPDAPPAPPLRQDADDMCMICFTDPLQAAPAIQLRCGHVFHLHCCETALANGWHGPRITFSFARCPICKEDMGHWTLDGPLAPVRRLRDEVRRKALMRLEYEGPAAARARAPADLAAYAMERYAYYACHKCGKAYFGGLARCEAETGGRWEPAELVCGACSDVAGARSCPKHGADFLEYKCRYCCSVAVFFCFGTSHFCNACHDDFQRVTNIPKHALPQCPAGPKGEQLPGTADECPLHVRHPPTGEEFALGCGVCRDAHAF